MSQSAEKFRRGTFLCFRKSLVSKNVRDKRGGGYHDFPSKFFCLTVPKNFVVEPFGVSEYFWYRKILCIRGGKGGRITTSVEKFLSHSAEKYRRGTLYCVINFGYRKSLCFRGLCHDFPSKIFCLTLPKHFVEETFSAVLQKFPVAKKFLDNGGGEYQDFPSKIFCLTVPEISVGESFTVALLSGTEKSWIRRGGGSIKIFRRKFFCLTVPKNFVEEPFCAVFQKISGSQKVYG